MDSMTTEEERKPNGSWAKYIGLCIGALLLSLVLQLASGVLFRIIGNLIQIVRLGGSGLDSEEIQRLTYQFLMDHLIWTTFIYQGIGIVVFGMWYYVGSGRPKLKNPVSFFNWRTFAGLLVVGIGLEFFVTAGVELVAFLTPDTIQQFEELMDQAGMNQLTIASFTASVLLAPIGEELLCRGIIFRYAKKASSNFVVANSIQALTFGIMHGNLVQGIYAFALGYVLGMAYERFGTLYAPMLLHLVINGSAMLLVPLLLNPLPGTASVMLLVMVLAAAVTGAGAAVIGKKTLPISAKSAEKV